MSKDYERNVKLERVEKFLFRQTEALIALAKLKNTADEQGETFNAVELQKIEKILANAQVRVIRLYHSYTEENFPEEQEDVHNAV